MRSRPAKLFLAVVSTAALVLPTLAHAAPVRSTGNTSGDATTVVNWILDQQYGTPGSPGSAVLTIADNDAPPSPSGGGRGGGSLGVSTLLGAYMAALVLVGRHRYTAIGNKINK